MSDSYLCVKVNQDSLLRSLNIMERCVIQNTSLRKLLSYHDMPDIKSLAEEFEMDNSKLCVCVCILLIVLVI